MKNEQYQNGLNSQPTELMLHSRPRVPTTFVKQLANTWFDTDGSEKAPQIDCPALL